MPGKKLSLGKGIDSLFSENSFDDAVQSNTSTVKLLDIEPNKNQPRKEFNEEALKELSDSISKYGIIQPLLVRPMTGGTYQLVAGERRWRAARLAGLKEVPVVIKSLSDEETSVIAMIENLQREDLSIIEEAEGIKYLIEKYKLTQEELSERLGKSRSAVTNTLRLLKLPDKIISYIKENKISPGHAKALLSLNDEKVMIELANRIIEENLSVRETEKIIKHLLTVKKPSDKKKKTRDKFYDEVELSLNEVLKRKVSINYTKKKGSVTIEFFDKEDLKNFIKYFDENK